MLMPCHDARDYDAVLPIAVPGHCRRLQRESGSFVPRKTAFVAGATRAVGTALVSLLFSLDDWTVLGVSRRPPRDPVDGVSYPASRPRVMLGELAPLPPVTHFFYMRICA